MVEDVRHRVERKLAFLGRPRFLGFADRPWPMLPWEGRLVRLSEETRVDGWSVWYRVLGREEVLYALEPRV